MCIIIIVFDIIPLISVFRLNYPIEVILYILFEMEKGL